MKKKLKIISAVTTKRFVEILGINIALSVIITALNFLGITDTQQYIFISATAAVLLSMGFNFYFMRICYFDLRNKPLYYISNYIAYAFYYILNLAVGVIFNNDVYAWLFSITKFARFSHYQWSSLISATVFIIVMIIPIHLAPLGMGYLFEDDGL